MPLRALVRTVRHCRALGVPPIVRTVACSMHRGESSDCHGEGQREHYQRQLAHRSSSPWVPRDSEQAVLHNRPPCVRALEPLLVVDSSWPAAPVGPDQPARLSERPPTRTSAPPNPAAAPMPASPHRKRRSSTLTTSGSGSGPPCGCLVGAPPGGTGLRA